MVPYVRRHLCARRSLAHDCSSRRGRVSALASPLTRLWAYAGRLDEAAAGRRSYRTRIAWATLFSLANKALDLAPPFLIGVAVDVVVERERSLLARYAGIEGVMTQLWYLAAATFVIWALESLTEYVYALNWRGLAQDLQHTLRLDAYEHVQGLELAFHEDRSTGGLMAVLNDDVNQLERFLDVGANDVLQLVATIVLVGLFFVAAAPSVALLAFLPMPVIVWGSLVFQRRLAPRYTGVREGVAALNAQLGTNLAGVATIKSFTAEASETARIAAASRDYVERNREAIRLSAAFVPLIRIAIVLGFTATLVLGGWLTLQGELLVGVYGTLVFMTQRLLWPLTRLGQTLDLYQRAMASTRRVFALLDTVPSMADGETPLPREAVRGHVRLEGVRFAYRDGPEVVRGVDLDLPAGATIAIVGATGAGKSSLVKLLLRFYDPLAGRITLDGHDVRTLRVGDLRGAIGLVSQDVFLFHGTVRENIAYGRPGADDAAIARAAELAEASAFIAELPRGYDTVVGERGQKLSGGQRQRVSLARAFLKDPPILVLDEATSAVDNETEAAIQRSLDALAVGRTTIAIAHRLSTIRHADRIHVMDAGRIVESGTHEGLLERGGVYAGLWRVQTGERERPPLSGGRVR
jgi:ATP-binding cassette, subfamily B, bacterial